MKSRLITVSLIVAIMVAIIAVVAFYPKNQDPVTSPPEQFHWKGTIEVPTVELLEGDINFFKVEEQIPIECQSEYVYYREDISYSGRWYNWVREAEVFKLNTGDLYFPGAEAYITPVMLNGQIEPHVIVSAEYSELHQAAVDNALEDKHWGIIIQLDLPTEELTGQLPFYMEIEAECWAGSYGGN